MYELRNENSKVSYSKGVHGRPLRGRKDNIKLDPKQIGCNSTECINVAAIRICEGLRKFVFTRKENESMQYGVCATIVRIASCRV